jgi:hypothetical protein
MVVIYDHLCKARDDLTAIRTSEFGYCIAAAWVSVLYITTSVYFLFEYIDTGPASATPGTLSVCFFVVVVLAALLAFAVRVFRHYVYFQSTVSYSDIGDEVETSVFACICKSTANLPFVIDIFKRDEKLYISLCDQSKIFTENKLAAVVVFVASISSIVSTVAWFLALLNTNQDEIYQWSFSVILTGFSFLLFVLCNCITRLYVVESVVSLSIHMIIYSIIETIPLTFIKCR